MPAAIPSERFSADVAAQIAALEAAAERRWLAVLEQDLDDIAQLLSEFPNAGRELGRDGTRTIRKLRLRRAPFYVWYRTADSEDTWLVRLFHVRQRTPRPRMR